MSSDETRRPRRARPKLIAGGVALAVFGVVAMSGSAMAGGKASTKVKIQGGGGEIYGTVESSNENKCANGRKIKVYKVKNGEKEYVLSDTAQANNDEYQWNAGNVGNGRYFAKAPETNKCEADKSKTVRSN
jgi:hypothetical protein